MHLSVYNHRRLPRQPQPLPENVRKNLAKEIQIFKINSRQIQAQFNSPQVALLAVIPC